MKLTKPAIVVNEELLYQYVNIVGVDEEGGDVDVVGQVKEIGVDSFAISVVDGKFMLERFYLSQFAPDPMAEQEGWKPLNLFIMGRVTRVEF